MVLLGVVRPASGANIWRGQQEQGSPDHSCDLATPHYLLAEQHGQPTRV